MGDYERGRDVRATLFMWIVSKRYDLAFIFGGALASLAVPFLVIWKAALLPILFWTWLLLFDGTHLWAAYSRTYLDRQFWKTDGKLLLWSPAVILLPFTAIVLFFVTGSMRQIEIFLVLAQGWAYFHLVRQHYGFLSLYDRKAGADATTHKINKWTLYVALWSAYVYFLISHPINRKGSGLPELAVFNIVAAIICAGSAVIFLIYHFRKRSHSPASLFTAVCISLYAAIFFWIAPMEPFFTGARNIVQSFLLIAIMMTLFHNIQYHAIVWHYNRKKYRDPSFGAATYFNKSFSVYAIAAILFAAMYVAAAWFSTEYPSLSGEFSEPAFVPIAFVLWWGVLFHHYYLDQKIWRVSKTKDLQQQLGIAA
jgi:hypothetical protein